MKEKKKIGGKDEKNDNKIWNASYGFEEENNLILLHIKFILNNKNKKRKWIDVQRDEMNLFNNALFQFIKFCIFLYYFSHLMKNYPAQICIFHFFFPNFTFLLGLNKKNTKD